MQCAIRGIPKWKNDAVWVNHGPGVSRCDSKCTKNSSHRVDRVQVMAYSLVKENGISHHCPWENDFSSEADWLVSFSLIVYPFFCQSSIVSKTKSVHFVVRIGQWLDLNYVTTTVVETVVILSCYGTIKVDSMCNLCYLWNVIHNIC